MDLITVYATDSSTDPEQQRRNREEASTRYHTANTPVVRPHQFQEPLHDTQQKIMEQLYLATEDACDILNPYTRPPGNDARRRISSRTNTIEHILDRQVDKWPFEISVTMPKMGSLLTLCVC